MKQGDLVTTTDDCPLHYKTYLFEVLETGRKVCSTDGKRELRDAVMLRVDHCGPNCDRVMSARIGEIVVIATEYLELFA